MSKVAGKRNKFAELRALRQAGKKKFDTYEVEQVDNLYEEVDEEGYKKIVRDRLNQDDFVVDDDGEGYADDGREEWDRLPRYESDTEDELPAQGKPRKSKKQKDSDEAKKDANDKDISEYFTKGAVSKAQPKAKVIKTEEDENFMASLLGEMDANIPAPLPRATKKRKSSPGPRTARALSPAPTPKGPVVKRARFSDEISSPVADSGPTYGDDDDSFIPTGHDATSRPLADAPMSDPMPSSPAAKAADRKSLAKAQAGEDGEDDEMMEVAHAGAINAASVNLSASRPPKKIIKADAYPSPANSSPARAPETAAAAVDASSWNEITEKLNVVSTSSETRTVGKIDHKDAVEEDGSLNFFWTDYAEVHGSLCLFGKVLHKKTGSYVSCFVKVDNILRKVYFLPRQTRVVSGEDSGEEIGMMDVYTEVDAMMTRMNVAMHKIKACTRKYAFELPDIPKEGQYMKLFYPYTKPQLEATGGETYSHVFGTNTALFEQFVLWKNIMGPCWLKIRDADFGAVKNASHCKLEVLVEHPNMISSVSDGDNLEPPPLTLMSVAMRTTFNVQANKQEILAMSARIYENVSLSDTTPADKLPCRTFTLVRPNGAAFPLGFEQLMKRRNRGLIKTFKNESEILTFFLAQLDVVDPDVLLGHQLEGVDYSILLNRLHEKKVHQWSRLGRLRRSQTQWPASLGKTGGSVFAERQLVAGRLLCDLANDAGKSTMFKCQSWSLTEMCSLYLPGSELRREVDNEVALKTWATTKEGFMDYVTHLEADTYFIAALALRVQILPLTKNLTNLAGNSWARTLTGTRAERNEFILLHEFHRNKYICPDKQAFKGRQRAEEEERQQQQQDEENGGGEGAGASKKKEKYKGGLVFEPEKGLYDKFVLVMDFNSLYPSIIQEFNICFTTVERTALAADEGEEDAVPDVPVSRDQGILPRLIATLVSRRRQVKSLMKDKSATAEQLATWDIKQLALKLTANSMYGCLGYTKSRFYARPLAVLTTFKGREILRSTKDLAESMSLQVIYGDTDSVMINANVDNVADALTVGRNFKKAVNERYRLLEIDIDNVFRRILLQAKKKYAAINMVEADGRWTEKMEVKGLDMRRREYCALSKEISSRILNEVLSGDETEVAVTRIHEYLRETAAKMRDGASVSAQKYIIFTQLGKAPQDYPNADSMPQVQVALRELARGKKVRKGDVMSYIITAPPPTTTVDADGSTTTTTTNSANDRGDSVARRAYTPQDVLKPDSGLVPDVEWYMGKQIFPPVERLCANIVGTSTAQLADALGLDMRRYAANGNSSSSYSGHSSGSGGLDIHPLESQMPDVVRFAHCARLSLHCRACAATTVFEGLVAQPERVSARGVTCGACGAVFATLTVVAQVEHAVRAAAARYYEAWLACDDASCAAGRTRQTSVYGTRCLGPRGLARDCLGRMRYEVSERDVYNQLLYYAGLWDVDKAKSAAVEAEEQQKDGSGSGQSSDTKVQVLALAEQNRVRFGTVKAVVDRYLDKCGRQWVAMDALFTKLGFAAA